MCQPGSGAGGEGGGDVDPEAVLVGRNPHAAEPMAGRVSHTHIFAHSVSALAQPWSQADGQIWSLPWELLTQWESKQVDRQLSRQIHAIMGVAGGSGEMG